MSYHTLRLLADDHRADLLREAELERLRRTSTDRGHYFAREFVQTHGAANVPCLVLIGIARIGDGFHHVYRTLHAHFRRAGV